MQLLDQGLEVGAGARSEHHHLEEGAGITRGPPSLLVRSQHTLQCHLGRSGPVAR